MGHNVDNVLELTLGPLARYSPSLLEDATVYGQIVANLERREYGVNVGFWQDLLPILTVPSLVHVKLELSYATLGNRDGDQLPDWIFLGLWSSDAMKVNGTMELSRCETILL